MYSIKLKTIAPANFQINEINIKRKKIYQFTGKKNTGHKIVYSNIWTICVVVTDQPYSVITVCSLKCSLPKLTLYLQNPCLLAFELI